MIGLAFALTLTLTDPFVVDGDTVRGEIAGVRESVRLEAIDAPELRHAACPAELRAGEAATREAWRLVLAARTVTVEHAGKRDRYGRLLGRVRVDGADLGATLVTRGLAVAWTGAKHDWCPGREPR